MKEVAGQEDKIDIVLASQAKDLVEALPTIIATDGITLVAPDVIVGRDENADGICIWRRA